MNFKDRIMKAWVLALCYFIFTSVCAAQPADEHIIFPQIDGHLKGIIDISGNVIVPMEYDWLIRPEGCDKIFFGREIRDADREYYYSTGTGVPEEFGFFDVSGNKEILKYDEIGTIHKDKIPVKISDKWGVIDCKGDWIIQPVFTGQPILYDSFIIIDNSTYEQMELMYNRRYSVSDYSGNIIIPDSFSRITPLTWWKRPGFIVQQGDKYGFYNADGKLLIPPGDYYIFPSIKDESVWIISDQGKKVYYPLQDKWITEDLNSLTSGIFGFESGLNIELHPDYNQYFWTDKDHIIYIWTDPEEIRKAFDNPYLSYRKDDKYGVFNRAGKIILPFEFDEISDGFKETVSIGANLNCVSDGTIAVNKNHYWALVDTTGRFITHFLYDEIGPVEEGFAPARIHSYSGFLNRDGKEITPFMYDGCYRFKDGYGIVYMVESTGLIDKNGNLVYETWTEDGKSGPVDDEEHAAISMLEEALNDIILLAEEYKENPIVSISGMLAFMPEELKLFPDAKEWLLDGNYIQRIEGDFSGYQNLYEISLTSNQLQEFPSDLLAIKNSLNLFLDLNQIRQIPVSAFIDGNLLDFSISYNLLESLPAGIPPNKSLKYLDLSNNRISELSASISNLKNLKRLYLNNNKINKIPPEFSRLKKLTYLNLSNNMLTQIPPELESLKKLETLNLSGNAIYYLPDFIINLNNLKNLYLEQNELPEPELERIRTMRPDINMDPSRHIPY